MERVVPVTLGVLWKTNGREVSRRPTQPGRCKPASEPHAVHARRPPGRPVVNIFDY